MSPHYHPSHPSDATYVTLGVFVLMGWSLLPNALRQFKIYSAPSNLGITRTWICRLNFVQRPIFFFQVWASLTSFKSQTWDPQLKVLPGGLVLRIFTSWKNPSISVGFEPSNLRSRGEHVIPRPPRPISRDVNVRRFVNRPRSPHYHPSHLSDATYVTLGVNNVG